MSEHQQGPFWFGHLCLCPSPPLCHDLVLNELTFRLLSFVCFNPSDLLCSIIVTYSYLLTFCLSLMPGDHKQLDFLFSLSFLLFNLKVNPCNFNSTPKWKLPLSIPILESTVNSRFLPDDFLCLYKHSLVCVFEQNGMRGGAKEG